MSITAASFFFFFFFREAAVAIAMKIVSFYPLQKCSSVLTLTFVSHISKLLLWHEVDLRTVRPTSKAYRLMLKKRLKSKLSEFFLKTSKIICKWGKQNNLISNRKQDFDLTFFFSEKIYFSYKSIFRLLKLSYCEKSTVAERAQHAANRKNTCKLRKHHQFDNTHNTTK